MIKKTNIDWLVDIRPNGANGKRYRKKFDTKAEALRWEAWIRKNKTESKEWEPKKADKRRLNDLIELWFDGHGINLKDGERRKRVLLNISNKLRNPRISDFTSQEWIQYMKYRIDHDKVSENTANHEQAYIKALFNELIRIGEIDKNPIQNIRKLKHDEPELSFLSKGQCSELLDKLKKRKSDAYIVSLICLSTGARWSEAEKLDGRDIIQKKDHHLITFRGTKNSLNRSVPVSSTLIDQFKRSEGRLFRNSYVTFKRVCYNDLSFELPERQLTHILRHTFASHFIMNGGNILVLQKILGHQSLNMTMRYAHLAPEHLEEAIKFNILNGHFVDKID